MPERGYRVTVANVIATIPLIFLRSNDNAENGNDDQWDTWFPDKTVTNIVESRDNGRYVKQ